MPFLSNMACFFMKFKNFSWIWSSTLSQHISCYKKLMFYTLQVLSESAMDPSSLTYILIPVCLTCVQHILVEKFCVLISLNMPRIAGPVGIMYIHGGAMGMVFVVRTNVLLFACLRVIFLICACIVGWSQLSRALYKKLWQPDFHEALTLMTMCRKKAQMHGGYSK